MDSDDSKSVDGPSVLNDRQDPLLSNGSAIISNVTCLGRFVFADPALAADYSNLHFSAHPPCKVDVKVLKHLHYISRELSVELIPLDKLSLHSCSFDLPDVGLFIFPEARSARVFSKLIRLMSTRELAIKYTLFDDLQLLIFSSKQLPADACFKICPSVMEPRIFIWGIFIDNTKTDVAPSQA